ncbi:MAG: hypothetical protein Q9222_001395 [Ikaeria aurantiellina]
MSFVRLLERQRQFLILARQQQGLLMQGFWKCKNQGNSGWYTRQTQSATSTDSLLFGTVETMNQVASGYVEAWAEDYLTLTDPSAGDGGLLPPSPMLSATLPGRMQPIFSTLSLANHCIASQEGSSWEERTTIAELSSNPPAETPAPFNGAFCPSCDSLLDGFGICQPCMNRFVNLDECTELTSGETASERVEHESTLSLRPYGEYAYKSLIDCHPARQFAHLGNDIKGITLDVA